jgi:hypothetical protein
MTAKIKPKTFLSLALVIGILSLLWYAVGCGGGSNSSRTQPATGNVQIKMGDAPADSVMAFELTITKIDLTSQGGGTTNVLNTPAEIELTHLAGTVESLALANVTLGNYTGAAISISNAEVTYIPAGSTTPVEKKFALNTTVNVTFNPQITIGAGISVLNFDLKLAQSLTLDAGGNVTGINPVFTVSVSTVAPSDEQEEESGEVEDRVGTVSSITAAGSNTPGSFAITPRSGAQPQTFTVDSNTRFSDGLAQFGDLKTNMVVEVSARTQSDGSLLATKVELVEAQEGQEAEGIVTDATGNPVTSFTLLLQDGLGSGFSSATIGTKVTVDASHAAYRDPLTDSDNSQLLSNLPFTPKFDNTTLAKGQGVEVDSSGTTPVSGTINANKVQLRKQALTGTIGPAAAGSNSTFTLLLDPDSAFVKLTGVSSINVYKVPKTEMQGLTALTQGAKVRVRGLLFFDGTKYQFVAKRISLP